MVLYARQNLPERASCPTTNSRPSPIRSPTCGELYLAQRAGIRLGGAPLIPNAADVEMLRSYAWPGNVRELAAVIERAAILGNGKRLEVAKALGGGETRPAAWTEAPVTTAGSNRPPPSGATRLPEAAARDGRIVTLDEAMRAHIEKALGATHGRIEGRRGAARLLGINPHTLRARMRKLDLDWSRFRPEDEDDATHPDA